MQFIRKPVETMRLSRERGEKLKEKSIEITLKIKELVTEQEIVNFLIDTYLDKVKISENGEVIIDETSAEKVPS